MYDTARGVITDEIYWVCMPGMFDSHNKLGREKREAEAVVWYDLSAKQGNACAQHNLGRMYEKGRGVEQDDSAAERWHRLSAPRG